MKRTPTSAAPAITTDEYDSSSSASAFSTITSSNSMLGTGLVVATTVVGSGAGVWGGAGAL